MKQSKVWQVGIFLASFPVAFTAVRMIQRNAPFDAAMLLVAIIGIVCLIEGGHRNARLAMDAVVSAMRPRQTP